MIDEFEVREMAGVYADKGTTNRWVQVSEHNQTVFIELNAFTAGMDVNQARKLARQFYRLALRVESRNAT